jgi:hypothetical protein
MRSEIEQITPRQLEDFLDHPQKAYEHALCEVIDNLASAELAQSMIEGFRSTAQSQGLPSNVKSPGIKATGQGARAYEYNGDKTVQLLLEREATAARKAFSLAKDWHVLHYALNGTARGGKGLLANAVLGGQEIPDVDGVMGNGPLRYLEAQRVPAVRDALAGVNPGQLLLNLNRRDAEAKGIYMAHTLSNMAGWAYLPQLFEALRAFYAEAARHGNALLFSIT